jgi:glutathione S-transferase
MKLYEFAPTRSIRVRWTLQELGVDFEAVTVNMLAGEHRSPAFLKLNPAGKLPVLEDGNLLLTESVVIVLHLAEKYPAKGLMPTDLGSTRSAVQMADVRGDRVGATAIAHRASHSSLSGGQAPARRPVGRLLWERLWAESLIPRYTENRPTDAKGATTVEEPVPPADAEVPF